MKPRTIATVYSLICAGILVSPAIMHLVQDQDQATIERVITVDASNWEFDRGTLWNYTPQAAISIPRAGLTVYKIMLDEADLSAYLDSSLYCSNGSAVIFKGINAAYTDNDAPGGIGIVFRMNGEWWILPSSISGVPSVDETIFAGAVPTIASWS